MNVLEPIGDRRYVFNADGMRGIAEAEPIYQEFEAKKKPKKIVGWKIRINGNDYEFDGKPLEKIPFDIPDIDEIDIWTGGLRKTRPFPEIYEMLHKGVRTCLDLPCDYYYHILCLLILQSWAIEKLPAVFYGLVVGGFGGGKTVCQEVMKCLSKHGFLAGSITGSGTARTIQRYKLALFGDEIDVETAIKDSEKYMVFRQGYRRNNPFVRMNKNTFEPEFFDGFSSKTFSLHSDIEKALKTRSLIINIGETGDNRLPVINLMKEKFLRPVFEELFFWYMDNIGQARSIELPLVNIDYDMGIEELRKGLYNVATTGVSAEEKKFLSKFKGRNTELGFIAIFISRVFGIDIMTSIYEAFKEKEESEREFDASSFQGILKQLLIDKYQLINKI